MEITLSILLGLLAGGLIGFLLGRRRPSSPDPEADLRLARSDEKLRGLEEQRSLIEAKHAEALGAVREERETDRKEWGQERERLVAALEELRRSETELRSEVEIRSAKLDERTQSVEALKKSFEEQKVALKDEFKLLSQKIYSEKEEGLEARNKKSVGSLLEPLKEQITGFQKRVNEVHKEQVEGNAGLKQKLEDLGKMNTVLQNEAGNLARALRGEKKTLGNWGEVQVEKLLEFAGLKKDREYGREDNFKDAQGDNYRPDFILYLPEGRHIIIDSKVSLGDYVESVNNDDPIEAEAALQRHVACVRAHIEGLSKKDYTKLEGLQSPDFVFMFMPMETAYLAAFEGDPRLFQDAYERKIAVVTPNTLLPILRTVASLWNIEKQNSSTRQLAEVAGKVHSKLVVFLNKFIKVEQQLETAMSSYRGARNTLVEGRGNLVKMVEGFSDLGVKTTKSLPSQLVEEASSGLDLLEIRAEVVEPREDVPEERDVTEEEALDAL